MIAPDYVNASGDALLYGALTDYSFDQGLGFLEAAGYALRKPQISRVLIMESGERAGEETEASVDEFRRRLEADGALSFMVWSQSRDDMFCTFRRTATFWTESYVIGGANIDEAEPFVDRLLQRFTEDASAGASRMLVVDWAADAAAFEWDEFWEERIDYGGTMLSLVGLPDRLASRFHPIDAPGSLPAPRGYSLLHRR